MTKRSKDIGPRPTGAIDVLLFVAALVGISCFIFLLPGQHLDSTARYDMDRDQVINRANIFLAELGFTSDQLDISARIERNKDLLASVQGDLGRKRTIEILGSDEGKVLPGYYWIVRYTYMDRSASGWDRATQDKESIFEIKMTLDGVVWSFDNTWSFDNAILDSGASAPFVGQSSRPINRDALAAVFSDTDSLANVAKTRLRAISDSTLRANLSFQGIRGNRQGLSRRVAETGSEKQLLDDLEKDQTVALDTQAVLSLARYYQPEIYAGRIDWRLDSLYVVAGSAARLAKVRVIAADSVFRQLIRLDMAISTLGSLQAMDVVFNPAQKEQNLTSVILPLTMIGIYFILSIMFIIVFFRRMMARLIDVKTALVDAVMMGIFFGLATVLSIERFADGSLPIWIQIGGMLLMFSIVAGATGLFIFIVSSVSESAARESWPQKWLSLILIRKGDVRNTCVGWAIVRGAMTAGVLLGLGSLALALAPATNLDLDASLFADRSLRPVLSAISFQVSAGYVLMMLVFVGIGSYAQKLANHAWLPIIAITVLGAFTQIAPFSLGAGWAPVVVSAAASFILAVCLIRFDFFTALLALVIAKIFWSLSEGFLIAGSPTWLDAILAILLLVAFFTLGVIGVLSKRSGGDVEQFLPEYITELAGQERVKRELEIAHQVQGSFLPRRMPQIAGLDIAGMCLPATEVGGDYFDFIKVGSTRLAFVVGDVSGKGIEAAFYMTFVKGVIQTLSKSIFSPAEVMRRTNSVFRENAPPGTFISMIYGVVDVETGMFTFSRAGHNPAILKRHNAPDALPLQPRGMAIGFTDGKVFDESIEEVAIQLHSGDSLVFYTDGFSEAMNSARELYGDERLVQKVAHVGNKSSGAILRSLTEDVHHFIESAGRSDDMTMVVIKMVEK